jgi:thiol-disulfide isomerase/thioredoxin
MDKRTIISIAAVALIIWAMPKWFNSGLPPNTFTMYYADWCPHCKRVMPEFSKFVFNGIQVRAVEQQQNNEYKVKGYPTFVYTNNSGWSLEFNGGRNSGAWANFLKSVA